MGLNWLYPNVSHVYENGAGVVPFYPVVIAARKRVSKREMP